MALVYFEQIAGVEFSTLLQVAADDGYSAIIALNQESFRPHRLRVFPWHAIRGETLPGGFQVLVCTQAVANPASYFFHVSVACAIINSPLSFGSTARSPAAATHTCS